MTASKEEVALRAKLLDAVFAGDQRQRGHVQEQPVLDHADDAADLGRGLLRVRDGTAGAVQGASA